MSAQNKLRMQLHTRKPPQLYARIHPRTLFAPQKVDWEILAEHLENQTAFKAGAGSGRRKLSTPESNFTVRSEEGWDRVRGVMIGRGSRVPAQGALFLACGDLDLWMSACRYQRLTSLPADSTRARKEPTDPCAASAKKAMSALALSAAASVLRPTSAHSWRYSSSYCAPSSLSAAFGP